MGTNFQGDMDEVKRSLNDLGIVADDDKLMDYANHVQNYMETEFVYIVSSVIPFPKSVPSWFQILCTEGLEAYFWFKENNDQKTWDEFKDSVARTKLNMFANLPSTFR